MSARKLLFATTFAVTLLVTASPAHALLDPSTAEAQTSAARHDGHDAFCHNPKRPLSQRSMDLCPLAADLPDCKELADACSGSAPKKDVSSDDLAFLKP